MMEHNKYTLTVNEKQDFDLTIEDLEQLNIIETQKGHYHFIGDNKSYNIEILHLDTNTKEVVLSVNDKKMQVKISDAYDRLVKSMGLSSGQSQKANAIKAPMPGLVLAVEVKEGQEVKEGDPILILEAMKMENVLKSPNDAVIEKIQITKNDTVEKGQLLVSLA